MSFKAVLGNDAPTILLLNSSIQREDGEIVGRLSETMTTEICEYYIPKDLARIIPMPSRADLEVMLKVAPGDTQGP